MLRPDTLKALPERFVNLLQDLEDYVIADIARRIKKQGELTDTATHQIQRSVPLGLDVKKLEEDISVATGSAINDIDREIKSVVGASIAKDLENATRAGINTQGFITSKRFKNLISAGLKQTRGELKNITGSMGFEGIGGDVVPIREFYTQTLDFVTMLVKSGTMDYTTATRLATKKMTDRGLEWAEYSSGRRNRVDVAVRRAIITGANQVNAKATELLMDDLGAEYVETTAHAGARPDHAEWQGQVFHVGGPKNGYEDFEESTQYGDVAGLCGANCRHSFFPFFPGVSERKYTDEELDNIDPPPIEYEGKTYTYYEANQKQRAMERSIRKTKREIAAMDGLEDKEMLMAKSVYLRGQKEKYKDFSKHAGLRVKTDRHQVLGFGRGEANKVTVRTEKHHQAWLKSIGASETKLDTVAKYYKGKYNKTDEFNLLFQYKSLISRGEISPLTSFSHYKTIAREIEEKLLGVTTHDGITINGYSEHFIARILGNRERKKELVAKTSRYKIRKGFTVDEALELLLKDDLSIDIKTVRNEARHTYSSKKFSITLSKVEGKLIQGNPRRRK